MASVTFQKVTVAQEAGFNVSWPDWLRCQASELVMRILRHSLEGVLVSSLYLDRIALVAKRSCFIDHSFAPLRAISKSVTGILASAVSMN